MNTLSSLKHFCILSVLLTACMLIPAGCTPAREEGGASSGPASSAPEQSDTASFPVQTEEVRVTIPGMKDEVKLAFLSDLHITVADEEIEDAEKENVLARRKSFANGNIVSEEQCPEWMYILNSSGADLVLFGGDLVDFASKSNIGVLKKGLEKLSVPFIYIRADHDTEPFYLRDKDYAGCLALQKELCEYEDVFVIDYPDFCIIGWNNSTIQLTPEGLEKIKGALSSGKPAILLTHVPIEPLSDTSLEDASRKTFGGRSLLWGFGQNDQAPNEYTSELLNMIYAEDTPFVEILAGHLHFSWDGRVSDKVHEHVFRPAFYGYMGSINVSGED